MHSRFFALIAASLFCLPGFAAPTYSVGEHQYVGDHLTITLNGVATATGDRPLVLPNGVALTYGQVLMLGDFYGIPDAPISKGNTEAEREARFLTAYQTFASSESVKPELQSILQAVSTEARLIQEAIRAGEPAHEAYAKISDSMLIKYNCITGGGCTQADYFIDQGRYIKLARNNFDHFGQNAITAYQAGHAVALHEALLARETRDLAHLQNAYAMNAFACHFLSDIFSAGHIRVPRVALALRVTPDLASFLLVKAMHDEDNQLGVEVMSEAGGDWVTYGDHFYFDAKNKTSAMWQTLALQRSLNQIEQAYETGDIENDAVVLQYVPIIGKTLNRTTPMFYYDEAKQQLLRRNDLNNFYDTKFTQDWTAAGTLLSLQWGYHLPSAD